MSLTGKAKYWEKNKFVWFLRISRGKLNGRELEGACEEHECYSRFHK